LIPDGSGRRTVDEAPVTLSPLRLQSSVVFAAAIALTLAPQAARAQNAPKALYGKSIVATWAEERVQRVEGQPDFRSVRIPEGLSIYVSTEGRIFSRRSASTASGRRSGKREGVGETGKSTSGGFRLAKFSGRTLTFTSVLIGAARNITISFDESFSSCRTSVIVGKAAGATSIRLKALATGQDLEIQSLTPTAETCAVQSGNVFAE
jgi:hypothetical protein